MDTKKLPAEKFKEAAKTAEAELDEAAFKKRLEKIATASAKQAPPTNERGQTAFR